MQTQTYSRICWIALTIFVVLHVCMPLTNGRLPSGHDTLRYLPRLVEFHENIRSGILIPRWAPDLILGQGQPLFFFSPPLPYYIAELWHLVGADPIWALNLAAICMILVSALGMFLLCRLYFGEVAGLLGAIAYLYSPYFQVDLYVRGALSELTAMAFVPLSLYGFGLHALEHRKWALALGSVSFAAVILSHNPSALVYAPLVAGFVLFQSWQRRSLRLLATQLAAVAWSLALSAFFWVPALLEIGNVHAERLTGGYSGYRLHFVFLEQLVSTFWGYGGSVEGPQDQMSLSLGWTHVVLGILALAVTLRRNRTQRQVSWFFAGSLVIYVWLMLPISAQVWHLLPPLQYTQFPWRLLAPAGLSLGMLVASLASLDQNRRSHGLLANALFAVAGFLLLLPNWDHAIPQSLQNIELENFTAASIARRGVETTTWREFEPRWVKHVLPYDAQQLRPVSGDANSTITSAGPETRSARVSAREPSTVEARLLYFPGWTVSIDGVEAPMTIAEETGRIRFDVGTGDHDVVLKRERTISVLIGEGISLTALLALLVMVFSPPHGTIPPPLNNK